jgi:hypothetical protein
LLKSVRLTNGGHLRFCHNALGQLAQLFIGGVFARSYKAAPKRRNAVVRWLF